MNIKFKLIKINNSHYEFTLIDINEKFYEKFKSTSIINISFKSKKIRKVDTWPECRISNDEFSFYLTNSYTQIEHGFESKEDRYLALSLIEKNKKIIINTDIENFDKIFIKAFRILSETYNNV